MWSDVRRFRGPRLYIPRPPPKGTPPLIFCIGGATTEIFCLTLPVVVPLGPPGEGERGRFWLNLVKFGRFQGSGGPHTYAPATPSNLPPPQMRDWRGKIGRFLVKLGVFWGPGGPRGLGTGAAFP